MPSPLKFGIKKFESFATFLFPQGHSISLHHSTISSNFLLYFRVFSLTYLTAIYLWAISTTTSALNNIIYLTMQGYSMTWLYFLLVVQDYFINGFGKWGRVFPLSSNLKYYIQIIYEIAFAVELPITIIFWGFLFKIMLNQPNVTTQEIALNANLHAGPFLLICIDTVFNTFSFPKSHFIAIVIFGAIYMVINMIYTLQAHIIYQPIPWTTVMSYVLMIGAIGLSFFMHWIGGFCYKKFKKEAVENQMIESLISEDERKNSGEQSSKTEYHEEIIKEKNRKSEDLNENTFPNMPVFKEQL